MENKYFFISNEGHKKIQTSEIPKDGKDYYWTCDKDVELPIFMDREGPGSLAPITLVDQFYNTIERFQTCNAFYFYNKSQKLWHSWTYKQVLYKVEQIAHSFIKLNIPARSCVAILSYNRPEWNLAFWASIISDCISFGIYMTNNSEECEHILNDSQAPIIFVEDQIQYDKIVKIKHKLPNLLYIVSFEPVEEQPNTQVILFKDLLEMGQNKTHLMKTELEIRQKNVKAGKCCILVYTSGTTGKSKGVMISHDNMTSLYKNIKEEDIPLNPRLITYLPCSHIAGLFLDVCLSFNIGAQLYFTDKDALRGSLLFYLQEVRPQLFLGVPRVYEKMQMKIMAQLKESNIMKRKLVQWALNKVRSEALLKYNNEKESFNYQIAKKIVSKILQKLGLDQVEYFFSGAAPLPSSTREFFLSMDCYINNFYGLSETTGGVCGLLKENMNHYHVKSCGQPLLGVECKIDPETQEILFRARCCFMGYLNQEEKTKQVIDMNKFVHTGDMGKFNDTNNLFIIGRIKEIIVTAGGENVAPYPIENSIFQQLKDFVSWVIVVGDNRQFLSVLLTIKNVHEASQVPSDEIDVDAKKALRKKGVKADRISEIFEEKNFQKFSMIVQKAIDQTNMKSVSRASKIRKWCLLPRDFSIPTDEMTPTMKLKRPKVEKHFFKQIDRLYNSPNM